MPKAAVVPPPPASYEDALAELERTVQAMEGGQLPLEHLLTHYARAGELLVYCRERLQTVEQQVKVLENDVLKDLPAA